MSRRIPRTVLVVDDDPFFSFELGGSLRGSGYTVVAAAKAAEAYDLILKQQLDLAVVDLDLPDKSGLELIRQAKHCGRPVKILAITGVLAEVYLEIARYVGADRAIRKPPGGRGEMFASEEWLSTIETMLQ